MVVLWDCQHYTFFLEHFHKVRTKDFSSFPYCVLLALSLNTTNENPSTDKLSRAINYQDLVIKMDNYELFHSQSSQGSLHSRRSHSQGTGGDLRKEERLIN